MGGWWLLVVWFSLRLDELGSVSGDTDASILSDDFELGLKQSLSTNGLSFLCPGSDLPCPECFKPCDWPGEERSGCANPHTLCVDWMANPPPHNTNGTESVIIPGVSTVHRRWLAGPFVPPLSFQWQETRERGVVINENGATVGEVVGDGLVLTFSKPSVMEFDVCLRMSTNSSYAIADFGYSNSKLAAVHPLGMKKIEVENREADEVWYCSPFDFQAAPSNEGTVRLFPINRKENYEEEDNDYTSNTTRALCYILGAFYCLLGVLSFIGLILFILQSMTSQKYSCNLPAFCSTAFVVICGFRASFMFLYPTGTFEFEPLTYFVVFETPTFVLFSLLIYMIYTFKRLVYHKGFFPGDPTPILAIGWTFVWGMWLIVTIAYSKVILEGDSRSPACAGCVEVSYGDEKENTRSLSIAYQSVIIAVTLGLTVIFFYYTSRIYESAKGRTKQCILVVGGTCSVAFSVRTILFLIILAVDFSSSVYLFCTLFFTEVLMMLFLLIQFNYRFIESLASSLDPRSGSSLFSSSHSSCHHSNNQSPNRSPLWSHIYIQKR